MKAFKKLTFLGFLVFQYTVWAQPSPSEFQGIQHIEISSVEVDINQKIETDYVMNNVVIRLDSTAFEELHYRILDDSKEEKWSKAKGDEIRFIGLKPGEHSFVYYTVNKKGELSKSNKIVFLIKKPWFRTWWFWTACFFIFFAIFYFRERFLKQKHDELEIHLNKIAELELRTLQLQMNPHFIFNALNSIQSFVMANDTITANDYLSKFAHLIRLFLDSSRSRYITITDEILLLRLYSEMEQLRFDNTFDYQIKVNDDIDLSFEIPTMILQPFVENAINHGLRHKSSRGTLEICLRQNDDFIIAEVKDNGIGRKRAREIKRNSKKSHVSQGLQITAERIETYNRINAKPIRYTIRDRFDISKTEDVGTLVEIKFPNLI
ncbi:sensor histidine kinase [Jiulongibacter sp. NS-SX5]|uniref:sensor histidine kinase n=1 Tax=Jiulongibacter sp. NS-SX5 TaxID=3463854 RepID=UPI0040587D67